MEAPTISIIQHVGRLDDCGMISDESDFPFPHNRLTEQWTDTVLAFVVSDDKADD